MGRDCLAGRRWSFVAAVVVGLMTAWVFGPTAASAAPLKVNCDVGGNLQNKINAAPNGSTILVKGTCKGTFAITGTALTLKGNPSATLNGQHAGSTLTEDSAGKTVHLLDLTITRGKAIGGGGGIHQVNGDLVLRRTTVKGNLALGSGGYVYGGGIWTENSGHLTLVKSRVTSNQSVNKVLSDFAYAYGGGIYAGDLTLTRTTVSDNTVRASSPDSFAYAYGGGVLAGPLTAAGSVVRDNVAQATAHGDSPLGFAYAYGGGLEIGSSHLTGSRIQGNVATSHAEKDFAQAYGGGVDVYGGLSLTGSTIRGNRATSSSSADFSNTYGGGVSVAFGSLTLARSSVNANRAVATASGTTSGVAEADGGGIYDIFAHVSLTRSTVGRNLAKATAASDDATVSGGGIDAGPSLTATNSTIAEDSGEAHAPAAGKTATIIGGGAHSQNAITVTNATVAGNQTIGTGDTVVRTGGGLDTATLTLQGSIVARNTGGVGRDCHATTATSNGHNLIGHKAGCTLSPKPSDKIGVRPKLGPLRDNGGPTQTMAIGATSPARNAIPPPRCAVQTDQRGVHRPQGPRCDIGAFERKPR